LKGLGFGRAVRTGKNAGFSPEREQTPEDASLTTVIVPKSGGVTSTKAVVVRWLKHEGDRVKVGDPLVELETEKVSYELESPFSGMLTRLLARETAEVPVGDPLCEIAESAAKPAKTKK
jgi:pyruvate/2-oxoglutarate dehydrogenase complex dihydrolipoamide acyltransferase (E2) component